MSIDPARKMLEGFSSLARQVDWVLHQIAETPLAQFQRQLPAGAA